MPRTCTPGPVLITQLHCPVCRHLATSTTPTQHPCLLAGPHPHHHLTRTPGTRHLGTPQPTQPLHQGQTVGGRPPSLRGVPCHRAHVWISSASSSSGVPI